MALHKSMQVGPDIISNTQCDMNFACLTGEDPCKVEAFVDRDLPLLRCRDDRQCNYRKKYQDWHLCTCPVKVAAHAHH